MFIKYKISSWDRVHLSDYEFKNTEEVINNLQKEGITFYTNLDEKEFVPLEKNDGHPTIKLYDDDGNFIWSNKKE